MDPEEEETTTVGTREPLDSGEYRRSDLLAARAERAGNVGSWELDVPTGEMLWSDNFYRVLGLEVGEIEPSMEYFREHVHPDDSEKVEMLIDRLDETTGLPPDRYRIVLPGGEVRHLEATLAIVGRDGAKTTRAIGSIRDVTEIREAEREVAAHRAVIEGLQAWQSLKETGPALLCELARPFDAAVGAVWVPRGDVLESHVVWQSRTVGTEEIVDLTLGARLPRGSGPPGLAWSRSEPVTVSSPADFDFDRARVAAETGLACGVAFPVVHSVETMMIIELLAREQIELAESLSLSLLAIGHQIGQFMARRRGELVPLLLTPRELQMLELAADGLSGPMIAEKLTISPSTVKTHFEHIYAKLGAPDRASAVAEVMRLGLFQ